MQRATGTMPKSLQVIRAGRHTTWHRLARVLRLVQRGPAGQSTGRGRASYGSDNALAIRTRPASIWAIWFCRLSMTSCASRVPITVPHPAHCNTGTVRCSPSGVTRPRSKVCPEHFAQVETAICRFSAPTGARISKQAGRSTQKGGQQSGATKRSARSGRSMKEAATEVLPDLYRLLPSSIERERPRR